MELAYELLLTPPGGGVPRDLAQLVQSITWSGSDTEAARALSLSLAVPRDGSVEPPQLVEGSALTFRVKGEPLFTGPLLSTRAASGLCFALPELGPWRWWRSQAAPRWRSSPL